MKGEVWTKIFYSQSRIHGFQKDCVFRLHVNRIFRDIWMVKATVSLAFGTK